MVVVKNYDEIIKIAKEKKSVFVDLGNLNYLDYTKAIDFISGLKGVFKKITRSKFIFFYD